MHTKRSKNTLLFILGGIMLVSIAAMGCNNGDNKDTTKDSTKKMAPDTSKKMAPDSTVKRDTMKTRPTVNP